MTTPSGPPTAGPPAAGPPAAGPPAAGPPAAGPPAEDRPLTRGEQIFYRVVAGLLWIFERLFWRVQVEGRRNIPPDGAFVVAPVHRSNIDTVLMAQLSRRPLRYMAKDSLWKYPWSARLLTALGGFPVNRDTADREALRTCESALRRGEAVVIFPEGTRKDGPVIQDLYQGAAFVALRAGVPIVPVGIGGSAGAMPKGSKLLHPVKIRMIVGAPIHPPWRKAAGARGSRRHVHELTAQLQLELQRLFDQAEGRSPEASSERPTAAG